MTTLLEQGIAAVKRGEKLKARELLTQVLRADDRSERAWLWLSEVVDTHEERIQCLEQVLDINPHNKPAQAALKKLQDLTLPLPPVRRNHSALPSGLPNEGFGTSPAPAAEREASRGLAPRTQSRRPFRLTEEHLTADKADNQRQAVNRQATIGMRNYTTPDTLTDLPPASYETASHRSAQSAPKKRKKQKKEDSLLDVISDIPFLPVLIFGTLSVTAVGGILMMIFLALSGV